MSEFDFRLYVAGDSPRSVQAIENLRRLFDELGVPEGRLLVIDVLERPEEAERERILTTPTLVRRDPPRRVTGDLSDRAAVLRALTLEARPPRSSNGAHS